MKLALTRRSAVSVLTAVTAFGGASVRAASPSNSPWRLWYRQPAAEWVEALPIGSGGMGAMVFGGVAKERLQLNEDTLWAGGPYDPANPEALKALPEIRKLLDDGDYAKATEVAEARFMGTPKRQMSYQTIGDLCLDFPGLIGEPASFERDLDLDGAIATTRFEIDGTRYRREVIGSYPDRVIAVRLTASKAKSISVDLRFESPLKSKPVASVEGRGTLLLSGMNEAQNGVAGALRFECRVRPVVKGGKLLDNGSTLSIVGADEVLLLISAATSYRSFNDVGGDPVAINRAVIGKALTKTWPSLLATHQADHRALFRRVEVDFGGARAAQLPTDQRIKTSPTTEDPALAALYYQYGRYLLIACSRPGGQAANLQGVWNDKTSPPWGGKYTININTEMNYWPAEPTGLAECVKPLIEMVRDLSVTGAHTARVMYNASGWVVHHNTDLWRASAPIDGAKFGVWPTGGAWLCKHLWDHYDYNRDRAYLADIYPLMRGSAEFFLDVLVVDPKFGVLVTNPSMSPENSHGHGSSLAPGPTMDEAILRDLFSNCIKAAAVLGLDAAFSAKLAQTRDKLAPFKIGKDGQLQEWQEDWDADATDIHHRHVSHLYSVFPSDQIAIDTTPKLAEAAKKTLNTRGDLSTGWATAWRLNLWARLGDGDHAHRILTLLLGPERTYPNMFDAHPPFQIDGNFGGTSGMTEMILQSRNDQILLLPALPTAWPTGRLTGLRARGAVGVDLVWAGGKLETATFTGAADGRHRVRYGASTLDLDIGKGQRIRLTAPGGQLTKA